MHRHRLLEEGAVIDFVIDARVDLVDLRQQRGRGAQGLEVAGDDLRIRIVGVGPQHVQFVDVGLVAEADELAEAHAARLGVIEHRGAKRATLRDESQVPSGRHFATKGGVHADFRVGVDNAQAVWTDQRDTGSLDLRGQLFL